MPVYNFTFVEYDLPGSGRVLATGRGSVELDHEEEFSSWAKEQWPTPRYAVRLDHLGRDAPRR